jgi:hypothetical protein
MMADAAKSRAEALEEDQGKCRDMGKARPGKTFKTDIQHKEQARSMRKKGRRGM